MKVLVIPEDFTKDEFILKPILKALFAEVGKPRAVVQICREPRLRGVAEALKWDRIADIIDMYPMVDLFLLCVDRDGDNGREASLSGLESRAARILTPNRTFIGACAWQELEVWALAGVEPKPRAWVWRDVRAARDPKEAYFEPLARSRAIHEGPGNGRKTLADEAARRLPRVLRRCPELMDLKKRLSDRIAGFSTAP